MSSLIKRNADFEFYLCSASIQRFRAILSNRMQEIE